MCFELLELSAVTKSFSSLHLAKVYLATPCSEGYWQPQLWKKKRRRCCHCLTNTLLPGDVAGGEINGYLSTFSVGVWLNRSCVETHTDPLKSGRHFVFLREENVLFPLSSTFLKFLWYLWHNFTASLVRKELLALMRTTLSEPWPCCPTAITIFSLPQAITCSSNTFHVEEQDNFLIAFW